MKQVVLVARHVDQSVHLCEQDARDGLEVILVEGEHRELVECPVKNEVDALVLQFPVTNQEPLVVASPLVLTANPTLQQLCFLTLDECTRVLLAMLLLRTFGRGL